MLLSTPAKRIISSSVSFLGLVGINLRVIKRDRRVTRVNAPGARSSVRIRVLIRTRSAGGHGLEWKAEGASGWGMPETRCRSIRLSVESRRYLSFSVSIVNIEVAPDTVNFAAPRQHCWGLKWNAGARRKRYVCGLTKRQGRSKCLLTRDLYLSSARDSLRTCLTKWNSKINVAVRFVRLFRRRNGEIPRERSPEFKCAFIIATIKNRHRNVIY